MAQLTINVPNELVPRVVAALHQAYPNVTGDTDAQFSRRAVIQWLRELTLEFEIRQDAMQAGQFETEARLAAEEFAAGQRQMVEAKYQEVEQSRVTKAAELNAIDEA